MLTQALPHEVTRYAQGALVVTPKVPVTTDSAPISQLTGSPFLGSLAPANLHQLTGLIVVASQLALSPLLLLP